MQEREYELEDSDVTRPDEPVNDRDEMEYTTQGDEFDQIRTTETGEEEVTTTQLVNAEDTAGNQDALLLAAGIVVVVVLAGVIIWKIIKK